MKRQYLNGYYDCIGNFNGCLNPMMLEFDEHNWTNQELLTLADCLSWCLRRNKLKSQKQKVGRMPRKLFQIRERYWSETESMRHTILADARKLDAWRWRDKFNGGFQEKPYDIPNDLDVRILSWG